jgi:hypothetical protein
VNELEGFTRFHPLIDVQSLYYPTAAQVQALGRATLRPGKVAVVLGGNSIIQGVHQGTAGNWAKHLQALLGDRFQVLNLAQAGGDPFEFGATAAEFLLPDHPQLLLVTNTWPAPLCPPGDPDGKPPLRYFFWQARARGLIQPYPEREARLRELEKGRDESFRELKRQCTLDARLDAQDLWNAVTYRYLSTVWSPGIHSTWVEPRRDYPDSDQAYPPADEAVLKRWSDSVVPELRGTAAMSQALWSSPPGGGVYPLAARVSQRLRECLRPEMRPRTLVLLNHRCPYYLQALTPEERGWFLRSFGLAAQIYAREGVRAAEVGRGLQTWHYSDQVHLTAAGGWRLAEEVAPMIRDLAEELGYLRPVVAQRAANGRHPPTNCGEN